MITPIAKNFKGLTSITGATRSGKSKLAEFLIKDQDQVTYIATSKPRPHDLDWLHRIDIHRKRRPESWTLIEYPKDICKAIQSITVKESILIDSLGGLVEQHLTEDDDNWNDFQIKFLNCLSEVDMCILIVSEEVGWGIVPATRIGHLFRERHSTLNSLVCSQSQKRWLAVNGIGIDLDKIGHAIP